MSPRRRPAGRISSRVLRRPGRTDGERAGRPAATAVAARPLRRWQNFRRAQLAQLRASNEIQRTALVREAGPEPTAPPTAAATASSPTATEAPESAAVADERWSTYRSPFKVGFFGALGVFAAWLLIQNFTRLDTTLTILVAAIFLTLALNPVVEALATRGLHRGWSVLAVFLALLGLLTLLGFLVVPPIVDQTTRLVEDAPANIERILSQPWIVELDEEYGIAESLETEATARLTSGDFVTTMFDGVIGAAGAVAGSVFGIFTVLVLTLYFLAALPAIKNACANLVPASRRPRVVPLGEEIIRRVGGYALGQVSVATINGTFSWVVLTILDLPYAAVLAVVVGVLGLIPLVGATIGAVIVALVALIDDPTKAIIVVIYYIVYQQFENYVIVPRVMRRTVSVPGAVTVVAVLAGGTLFGVLGALVAIPVAAGLLLLYEEVLVPRQDRL